MSEEKRNAILVGDIGGTNTRLAIIELVKGRFHFLAEQTFPSREEPSLESALRKFLANQVHPITQAAFGVAGPVRHGRSEATNLPWVIDSRELARKLSLPRVGLINDWEAGAYGIDALEAKDFEVLNPGAPDASGNRAVIAAGTGLGEVGLFWDDREYRPFASEGGHVDFAPRNHLEMEPVGLSAEAAPPGERRAGHLRTGAGYYLPIPEGQGTRGRTEMAGGANAPKGPPGKSFRRMPWPEKVRSARRPSISSSPCTAPRRETWP